MKTKARDFLGQVLNIGDEVVFMSVGMRSLSKGIVKRLGAKKCTISTSGEDHYQFFEQVVKINK